MQSLIDSICAAATRAANAGHVAVLRLGRATVVIIVRVVIGR